jgi:hypothetical protein
MIYSISWVWILVAALLVGLIAGAVAWFFAQDFEPAIPAGLALFLVGGLAFAIPMGIREDHSYQVWCAAQGGHTDSHTSTSVVTTVNANGTTGVGTATNTTTYCLTSDGRIIDVQ